MSTRAESGVFATQIAASLTASGIQSWATKLGGDQYLCLFLSHDGATVAWLAIDDMTYAATIDVSGTMRMVPRGPFADLAPCESPSCVAGQIVAWLLGQRAGWQR